ncbi:MAG TPA: TRAP transporter substrate-binding protein, partial [Roseobacter sp.]|nr:TRAP transporter substrate-binding protein [Roseobacter sp.]
MKFTTHINRTAFAIAAGLTLALAPLSAHAKDWRGWNIHVVDYPVSHGMEAFMAEVDEKTEGAIKGKVFHAGVLGSQPDAIEQLRLGVLDFGVFSLG